MLLDDRIFVVYVNGILSFVWPINICPIYASCEMCVACLMCLYIGLSDPQLAAMTYLEVEMT